MVSHDSGVGSQPSAVVEPSAGSEGQEKGGPQPADLLSEDSVQEGSDVGGDSLGAQAGPVDVPPSDETPQPAAGSVAEMPAADGDSAGEEEDGSAGSDEDGWEDGLSNTSQLSDITASQRGKLYSLTEISDFLEKTKGTSSRNDDGEAAAVVQRAEVEEPPRPEPRPRRKRPEEPGTSAAAAEPGAAAPADADKEGVFAAVIKKRKLKKRTSAAADPAAGEEESVWGPIMVSHDSDVGSQPSAVVEPSAGSEGQEKGGPQPADLVSEDPVLEGSDVGGDSLGAQAGPVDVPPSDETPQPAGSVAEMPAADGDSAGEEENGSDEDGWEDGLSDTSQLSDITASQRGKLYSLTEISDFLEKTKAPADADKEGVFAAVIKKRKLKKRTSAADPAAGEEESVLGPIMVSHDSGVGSQPSAVVEPSAGSEGQEKGGPQPADLLSEDSVQEGSDVGGDSLGAQAGPVDVPPSDETPQPAAGSVAEMPAADGDSAGEEEDGSAGSDEDGWEDGLSNTSQLSDITASQRGKLYSLTEISDFLEKTKGNRL
ncbi:UNVERIFIED_CONTAM: hypothetical protein FKN15_036895 [Acipenser sinensis]